MKTFKEFIQEKWVADIPKRDVVFPIYENPSSKDLVALKKTGLTNDLVRFAAIQSKKKIYVWSGMDIIHDNALNKLVKDKIISRVDHNNLDQVLCGECKLLNGSLTFSENDGMDSYFGAIVHALKNKKRIDSSFIPQPYFDVKEFLDDLPNILEKYKWVGKFIDEYDTKSSLSIIKQMVKK